MDNTSLIELLTQVGGPSAVAIFAIYVLNRVWKDRVTEAQRYAEHLERALDQVTVLHERTLDALDRNTLAWARLMERVND